MSIRVCNKIRFETVVELAVTLGVVAGVGTRIILPYLYPDGMEEYFLLLVPVTTLMFAIWLNCFTHRKLNVLASVYLFCAAFFLVWITAEALCLNPMNVDTPMIAYVVLGIVILVVSSLAGVLGLLTRWFIRLFLFTIEEQDGYLCWKCGYPLGKSSSDICPECGWPSSKGRSRWGVLSTALDFFLNHVRVFAIAITVLALFAAAYRYLLVTQPQRQFVSRFIADNRENYLFSGPITRDKPHWSNWSLLFGFSNGEYGFFQPLAGMPNYYIAVFRYRSDDRDDVCLQLRLEIDLNGPAFPGLLPDLMEGSPRVHCNLSPDSAEYIYKYGIPEAMISAFIKAAEGVKWETNGSYRAYPPGDLESVIELLEEDFIPD